MYSTALIDEDNVYLCQLETAVSRAASYCTYVPFVDGLLIDTGFAHAGRSLLEALRRRRVEQAVNTHAHEDHIGNNSLVVKHFGALLQAPAAALPMLERPQLICTHLYQHAIWGLPSPSHATALGGQVRTPRFSFQVIPTPGHCADHVCFYEPQRGWLFGGDLFLSVKVRLARGFENAQDLIDSLRQVCALNLRYLFCYHRGALKDPLPMLRAKIDFMEGAAGQIRSLHDAGAGVKEIADRVLGKEPLTQRVVTLGDLSKANLVRAFLKERGAGYET